MVFTFRITKNGIKPKTVQKALITPKIRKDRKSHKIFHPEATLLRAITRAISCNRTKQSRRLPWTTMIYGNTGKKSLVKIVEGQGDTTARTCVSNVCPTHVYSKFNWLSIFEAPLISRNRDRNRVRRLNSEFKRRGCVKLRPRGGLKIISPTTMLRSRGGWKGWLEANGDRFRLKLTLNDFSTLPLAPSTTAAGTGFEFQCF